MSLALRASVLLSWLCACELVELHSTFSRHAKAQASLAVVIWLNENVPTQALTSSSLLRNYRHHQRQKHRFAEKQI